MILPGKQITRVFLTLLLSALLFLSACSPLSQPSFQGEVPIEPVVSGLENTGDTLLLRGRFSVINPETVIYALCLSSDGEDILFCSDARSISMLDNQGHLRWEAFLEGLPITAALAPDGSFAAAGTDCGRLYLLGNNGRALWEKNLEGPVRQVALDPEGGALAASLEETEEQYKLCIFEQWGDLRWEKGTASLQDLQFLPGNRLAYLEKTAAGKRLVLSEDERILWETEAACVAFSEDGGSAALYHEGGLQLYQLEGEKPRLLWSSPAKEEISFLALTERGERLLAYSTFPGTGSNLFAFEQGGALLWEKKIPAGALLQTSRYGEKIVASSWQEYSEDFSKLLILDDYGEILQELEMASRIVKMALSREGNILTLAGNDGNIFILDAAVHDVSLQTKIAVPENADRQENLYHPVVFRRAAEEYFLTLYFYDENALHLIPVSRRIKSTTGLLQAAVNELVKGPCRASGLSRTLPKDLDIPVLLEEGTVTLNLPGELNHLGGSTQIMGIIDSLLFTVSQFPAVENICFIIDGEAAPSFGAEGLSIEHPFLRRSLAGKKVLYLPYRSGERYYLLPRELIPLNGKGNGLQDLLQVILAENRYYLPAEPLLNSITNEKDWITLDWGTSFKNLFPWQGTPDEKARAALFLDSLLLTLGSNFNCKGLVHLVDGRQWEPPPGYPALQQEFKRTFYLNPE